MANHVFPSAITSAAAGSDRARINQLRVSAKAWREKVIISLASIESSVRLLDEISRSNSSRLIAPRLPEKPVPGTPVLRTKPRSRPMWWDVYPALPKSIRLGEIEAADEREAIEKASKKFQQPPAVLIVMRRA